MTTKNRTRSAVRWETFQDLVAVGLLNVTGYCRDYLGAEQVMMANPDTWIVELECSPGDRWAVVSRN